MNQGRKFAFVVGIVAAIGFIAFQAQRTDRPELDTAVVERTMNGFVDYHARHLTLPPLKDDPQRRIEWSAVACADPTKPELIVNFRNVGTPREIWEPSTLKPIALVVEGRSLQLSPFQAL